jgi:hypothetical protein
MMFLEKIRSNTDSARYPAYSSWLRRVRHYLRSWWQGQSVAKLSIVETVDAHDKSVLTKRGQRQAWEVGGEANMLVIAETTATWLMLGDTNGNRALTIAVVTMEITLRLRPITGWNSTNWELAKWRPKRGG